MRIENFPGGLEIRKGERRRRSAKLGGGKERRPALEEDREAWPSCEGARRMWPRVGSSWAVLWVKGQPR